jgi:hypothetical protein
VASRNRAAIEGVRVEPAEAVAITLELAEQIRSGALPGAPQDPAAVELAEDGQVAVDIDRLGDASPEALAGLLQSLLTTGGERPVPGALMLTIARAKGEIDLSGFATVADFAAALRRFAPSDSRRELSALYERLASVPAPVASEPVAPPDGGSSIARVFAIAALVALFSPQAERASPGTGRVPVEVTSAIEGAYSPSFAPSGEALYFHTGRDAPSALVRAPGADGDTQLLRIVDDGGSNFHVRPSPDGKSIAFDSNRDGERGVYVARADGSGVRRVSGEGHAAVPSWSPDGVWLAFVKAERGRPGTWNVWLLKVSTNEQRQVTTFTYGQPWGASWFPDGRRIAYSHEDRLIVRDLATGATRVFQSPGPGRLVRTPAVSPDGTRIIYQVYRDGVWLLDVRDGSARRVLDDPTAEEFAWDPAGRRVAFHSRRGGGWSIFVMAAGS